MSIIKFSDIVKCKKEVTGHFMVRGLEDKKSPKSKYVTVTLYDGEEEKGVNFFHPEKNSRGLYVSDLERMGIIEGSIIETSIVSNDTFFNVKNYKLCTDNSVTKEDFKKKAPIDIEEAYNWILNTVKSVDSGMGYKDGYYSISNLAIQLLERNKDAIKKSSAAAMMHHNCIGGLLYHTQRMLKLALNVCDTYEKLDKELLICGVAIHDIGKIHSLETDDIGTASVTLEGLLLEHSVIGIKMIQEEANNNNYDPERIVLLQHMIASHHGKKDWDAIVTPSIPEATMLHFIDMRDSRMYMFEEAYKSQEPGTISSNKVYGLDSSFIYLPSNTSY